MSRESDIKRFVANVMALANDTDDFAFVRERVQETVLYKLLSSRYDNVDELMEQALKKATIYERMRTLIEREWRRAVNQRVYDEDRERKAQRAVFYARFLTTNNPETKELFDKFQQRHGLDSMMDIALETVDKYPSDGSLYKKFRDEFDVKV